MQNMLASTYEEGYMDDDKRKKFHLVKKGQSGPKNGDGSEPHEEKDRSFIKDKEADLLVAFFAALGASLVMTIGANIINSRVQNEKNAVYLQNFSKSIENLDSSMGELQENFQKEIGEVKTELKADISQINDDVKELKGDVKELGDDVSALSDRVSYIEGRMDGLQLARKVSPEGNFKQYVALTYESDDTAASPPASNIKDSDIIAIDVVTKKQYTDADLQNETIILSYTDNGEEVYFRGQFDEKLRWDDHCVINRYKDNSLVMVMEADYKNGKLLNYKQIFPYINTSGVSVWAISEREVQGDSNSGYTKTYYRTANNEIRKSFDAESFGDADIIDVESFGQRFNMMLEGYYSGYTSNGMFHDTTGTAYMIKYDRYGYIRMLYVGGIVNGQPSDTTNNAWYIVKEEDTEYMYYKGIFEDGHPIHNPESTGINPLSAETREEILGGNTFGGMLNWYVKT